MRISDGSSDVCSSDLVLIGDVEQDEPARDGLFLSGHDYSLCTRLAAQLSLSSGFASTAPGASSSRACLRFAPSSSRLRSRSDARRVGKEPVSPCRSRCSPTHHNKNPPPNHPPH